MAVKTTEDLIRVYPEQFDRVGHFDGKYRIVVRPEAQPVIHAPWKCPIHLKDELKAEMDKMVKDKIIRNLQSGSAASPTVGKAVVNYAFALIPKI